MNTISMFEEKWYFVWEKKHLTSTLKYTGESLIFGLFCIWRTRGSSDGAIASIVKLWTRQWPPKMSTSKLKINSCGDIKSMLCKGHFEPYWYLWPELKMAAHMCKHKNTVWRDLECFVSKKGVPIILMFVFCRKKCTI